KVQNIINPLTLDNPMQNVYIKAVSKFLPNVAVTNDRMEQILGLVNGNASRAKAIVLRNNKIKSRHYAIDENGNPTHNNTDLTVEAIKNLLELAQVSKNDIDILSCGTSSPDQ